MTGRTGKYGADRRDFVELLILLGKYAIFTHVQISTENSTVSHHISWDHLVWWRQDDPYPVQQKYLHQKSKKDSSFMPKRIYSQMRICYD